MKIAHIADVHFRSLIRHEEYRKTFQYFIDDIKERGVDYVWVGGDIFHTKTTGISPEFIELATWWIKSISEVCELHMMLGNHDGNLLNPNRQDAITPIVNALNLPNVFLYKYSGVYSFKQGYNWCVYSLFDRENWESVRPVSGDINIACYHGAVYGSKTETGYEVGEHELSVEFFNGYDFVFLGDIHKRQNLGYRESIIEVDKKDIEKYSDFM